MSGIDSAHRTKVFIHGNPESDAIWGPLTEKLAAGGCRKIVHLSPPGFGAPVPRDWGASQAEYRDWLVREVKGIDDEVDVVGHDWGAGHVYGLLEFRPDNVVTWAADCGGLVHPDYTWHDAAIGWQTPEIGEAMIEGLVALSFDEKCAAFSGLGMTPDVATSVARAVDATMGRCVLALYRSASQPAMKALGERVAASGSSRNGAVIVPTADPYPGTPAMARDVAHRLGATTIELEGRGHWWMLEDPATAASSLIDFWNRHGI